MLNISPSLLDFYNNADIPQTECNKYNQMVILSRLQVRQFYVPNSKQRSGNSIFKIQEEKRYLTFKSFNTAISVIQIPLEYLTLHFKN